MLHGGDDGLLHVVEELRLVDPHHLEGLERDDVVAVPELREDARLAEEALLPEGEDARVVLEGPLHRRGEALPFNGGSC